MWLALIDMILHMMTTKKFFLKKVPIRLGDNNEANFVVNKDDEYCFAASDILMKLPNPLTIGGSLQNIFWSILLLEKHFRKY